jgi:hypothetical protein
MRLGAGDAARRADSPWTNRGAYLMVASSEIEDRGIAVRSRPGAFRVRHAFAPTRLSISTLVQAYQNAVPVTRFEMVDRVHCGARRENRKQA